MNTSDLPIGAVWILTHFVSSESSDALMGDLTESIARGRSTLWLWKQVAIVFGISLRNTLRSHPLIAVRVFVVGYLLSVTFELVGMLGWGGLVVHLNQFHPTWTLVYQRHYFFECDITLFITGAVVCVIVSTLDRDHPAAAVLIWWVLSLFCGCLFIGYCFLDPVRRYATQQFEGMLFTEIGKLVGVLLSFVRIGAATKKISRLAPK